MPRTRRLLPEQGVLHTMARGNNKMVIFPWPEDYEHYKKIIIEVKKEEPLDIHHYCFMPNHVHLIPSIWQKNLSQFMKKVNMRYLYYYKRRYKWTGHFWQGRFKSNIIEREEYLFMCGKYIELNPVRAGLVSKPQEYSWSSYRYYAYGQQDEIITEDPYYQEMGRIRQERQQSYKDYIIDSDKINAQKLKTSYFIGSPEFVKKMTDTFNVRQ